MIRIWYGESSVKNRQSKEPSFEKLLMHAIIILVVLFIQLKYSSFEREHIIEGYVEIVADSLNLHFFA